MLHNTLLLFNIFQFPPVIQDPNIPISLSIISVDFFFRKSNPLDCSKTSPPIHQHRNITFPWKISPTQPNPTPCCCRAPSTRATATNRRADKVTALSRINPAMDPDLWPVGKPNGRNVTFLPSFVKVKKGGQENQKSEKTGFVYCTCKMFTWICF